MQNLIIRQKLELLNRLGLAAHEDAQVLRQKLELLKEIALQMLEEIEALSHIRSINLTKGISLHEEMDRFEIHLIQSALERTGGHQTKAAQLLGISLTTLHNKLKRLGISAGSVINAAVVHEDKIFDMGEARKRLRGVN